MLQKSNASPILGLTESPFLPHSDSSSHQGTELKFPFAAGNTVSPPSSTSDLSIVYEETSQKVQKQVCVMHQNQGLGRHCVLLTDT